MHKIILTVGLSNTLQRQSNKKRIGNVPCLHCLPCLTHIRTLIGACCADLDYFDAELESCKQTAICEQFCCCHRLRHNLTVNPSLPFITLFRFTLKGNLNRHLPIHTGERHHKCPHCAREFVQAVALRSHLFIHTGRDGFCCQVCGKGFSRKARMEEHVRAVHGKQRPYACDVCERKFSRKEDLTTHQEHLHGLKRQCPNGQVTRHILSDVKIRANIENLLNEDCVQEGVSDGAIVLQLATNHEKSSVVMLPRDGVGSVQKHGSQLVPYASIVESGYACRGNTERILKYAISEGMKGSSHVVKSEVSSNRTFSSITSQPPHLDSKASTPNAIIMSGTDLSSNDFNDSTRGVSDRECLPSEPCVMQASPGAAKHWKNYCQQSEGLCSRIRELLHVLVEEPILRKLGWPDRPINDLLEAVIRHCGCSPSSKRFESLPDALRENCKVFFIKVLEDEVAEKLLKDDETVDTVLDRVLQLARL